MNTTEVSWYNPEHGRDLNLNLVDPGGSNPSQGNISSGIHSLLLMHLAKNHRYSGREPVTLQAKRWHCPIYKGTLETLIWSQMWNMPSFFWLEKCLFLWVSRLLLINEKCASHFRRETASENKQFKETNLWYLIQTWTLNRQHFLGYWCKSGIAIFARRVTCIYAYSPFKWLISLTDLHNILRN